MQDYQEPRLALYRLVDLGLGKPFRCWRASEPTCSGERFARAVVNIVEHLDVNLVTDPLHPHAGAPTPAPSA